MTLPPSCLQLGPQPLTGQLVTRRRRGREEALTSLLRRTGLLDDIRFLEEERRGWRHADVVEIKGESGRSRCLEVVSVGIDRPSRFLWRAGFVARLHRWRESHKVFHSFPVCAGASSTGGYGWLCRFDERAVDVAQGSGLHALSALGAAARDDCAVDGVGRLV